MKDKKDSTFDDELHRLNKLLTKPIRQEDLSPGGLLKLIQNKLDPSQATASAYSEMALTLWEEAEPDAKRGRKVLESAKAGHRQVWGSDEEKLSRKLEIERVCLEISSQKPRFNLTRIRNEAAKRLGMSYKTVQRATPDLAKKVVKAK